MLVVLYLRGFMDLIGLGFWHSGAILGAVSPILGISVFFGGLATL
jgi:hypothetical protein